MATLSFEMSGAAELVKALEALPAAIEAKVLRDMLMLGARDLANDFRARAPIQSADQTGGHPPGTGLAAIETSSAHRDGAPQARVVLRPEGYFLSFYEFGSRHQPARPFMRPALDVNAPAVLEEMVDFGNQRLADAVAEAKG